METRMSAACSGLRERVPFACCQAFEGVSYLKMTEVALLGPQSILFPSADEEDAPKPLDLTGERDARVFFAPPALFLACHEGGSVISTSSASLDPMISTSESVTISRPLRVVDTNFPAEGDGRSDNSMTSESEETEWG